MDPTAFVTRFIREPAAIEPGEYAAFFAEVLWQPAARDALLAWLAAASARPFDPAVAIPFVQAIARSQPVIDLEAAATAVNIVGAGGGRSTFNISTTASFVAAAAGARVLKSGSPAYSSRSGSSDVLRALGLASDAGADGVAHSLDTFGLAFAPPSAYPAVLRRMATTLLPVPLKAVGDLVNRVGPMLCPYRVLAQVTGVPEARLLAPYAEVLRSTGPRRGWVVHAAVGMDELCSLSANHVVSVHEPHVPVDADARSLGCRTDAPWTLDGDCPAGSARIVESVLSGEGGAAREDTVALNAAAVLVVGGVEPDLAAAFARSRRTLHDGSALQLLRGLQRQAEAWRTTRVAVSAPHSPVSTPSIPEGATP